MQRASKSPYRNAYDFVRELRMAEGFTEGSRLFDEIVTDGLKYFRAKVNVNRHHHYHYHHHI